jgi:drug/metabolite transporter (DMT)-like permease
MPGATNRCSLDPYTRPMPLAATALVLAAALLHATWNAAVKASGDPLRATARAVWLGTLAATPFAAAAWLAQGRPGLGVEAWPIAATSAAFEVVYWVALGLAYRAGALSTVYPVARGSAALLGALLGIAVLGERLAPLQLAGVALLVTGTLASAVPGAARRSMKPALAIGAVIAAYTFLDRLGARTGPAWLYGWLIFAVGSALLAAALAVAPLRIVGPPPTRGSTVDPGWWRPLGSGVFMVAGYTLVLTALAIAPLAGVAPLRESATVLAAGWGVIRLGEREGAAWRLGGAGSIAVGAILLAIGS